MRTRIRNADVIKIKRAVSNGVSVEEYSQQSDIAVESLQFYFGEPVKKAPTKKSPAKKAAVKKRTVKKKAVNNDLPDEFM